MDVGSNVPRIRQEKSLIGQESCLQFYNAQQTLYLEIKTSKLVLEMDRYRYMMICVKILKMLQTIVCQDLMHLLASVLIVKTRYDINEGEAFVILPCWNKFHHYDFGRLARAITYSKQLCAFFQNDITALILRLWHILFMFINTMLTSGISKGLNCILWLGCADRIMLKTKMKKSFIQLENHLICLCAYP